MKRALNFLFAVVFLAGLAGSATPSRAEIPEADQQGIRTKYVGKVLFFRNTYRMAGQLEVSPTGEVKGAKGPGYWAVDDAVQVKDIDFRKDRVTFKCLKLWANIKDDGQLHFFPASAALKGKSNYPETVEITFRTANNPETATQLEESIHHVFLSEQEPKLSTAPQAISAYIQKSAQGADADPAAPAGFSGTLPKPISRPIPNMPREAQLVGQTGQESFIVLVDDRGNAAVVGFTHLLQYGLEETTIDAVKSWRFEPATKDGKPVTVRIPMSIDYKDKVAK
jgi:hypothetical protein